ncbi:MAG: class I SAM-dependent methyltransferase [Anaerolineae bacterium]|nr:class I SAM-dependent methyltransferase [Anaerolineae bacterium]
MNPDFRRLDAQLYDRYVPDWPGEIDFYRELATQAQMRDEAVFEVACGTGRIAVRLAQEGVKIIGLDLSPDMLEIAKRKSSGMTNVRWVEGDMRSFELSEQFGLAIIPGHAFQNLLTPEDQMACLTCMRRHLRPGGLLVVHLDHQDMGWLGDISAGKAGVFEQGDELTHPQTGGRFRSSYAWSYERATQTAILMRVWEQISEAGDIINRVESGPIHLHCVFRYEMEHLARRAGFEIDAVCGDFLRNKLQAQSSEMVWMLRNR